MLRAVYNVDNTHGQLETLKGNSRSSFFTEVGDVSVSAPSSVKLQD